jgi:hypothetical protein
MRQSVSLPTIHKAASPRPRLIVANGLHAHPKPPIPEPKLLTPQHQAQRATNAKYKHRHRVIVKSLSQYQSADQHRSMRTPAGITVITLRSRAPLASPMLRVAAEVEVAEMR